MGRGRGRGIRSKGGIRGERDVREGSEEEAGKGKGGGVKKEERKGGDGEGKWGKYR